MDLPGTALILPGVICLLLLALQWGGTKYSWNDGRITALLVLAGLLVIGFVVVQIHSGERATMPNASFCSGTSGVRCDGLLCCYALLRMLHFSSDECILTVIFISTGTGLLSTLQVNSGHAEWIDYQDIFGAGVGLGLQAAFTAAQTALELTDTPIGITIMMSPRALVPLSWSLWRRMCLRIN